MRNAPPSKALRVILVTRLIPHYRLPLYRRLAQLPDIRFSFLYGPSYPGTKLKNASPPLGLEAQKLKSWRMKLQTSNGLVAMPVSPGLIYRLVRASPDLIICEGASNLINTSMCYLYKWVSGAKLIWWSLGAIPGRSPSIWRRLLDGWIQRLERSADAVLAYSTTGKEYFIKRGIEPGKIFVAVNVVDTSERLERIASYDVESIVTESHRVHDFNVLFVGALGSEKNVDVLLKAYTDLEREFGARVSLTIVGGGPELEGLRDLSHELGAKNVCFTGPQFEDVSRFFLGADVFVLPGLGGLAISEAMVHGLPVIAGQCDGTEADLINSENGTLIAEIDEIKLGQSLRELLLDPSRVESLKAGAKATIRNRHNIESCLEVIASCIWSVCPKERKHG